MLYFLAVSSPTKLHCNDFCSFLLNAVYVKRVLRVGCFRLSLNTSLREKLKQQINKVVVV